MYNKKHKTKNVKCKTNTKNEKHKTKSVKQKT